jgi:hypothetical protein
MSRLSLERVTMSHRTLRILRVAYYTVALFEWLQLYRVRRICLSLPDPYASFLLGLLLLATVGMIAGVRPRATSLLNYLLVLGVQQFVIVHYHVDYLHVGMGLVFLLAPDPPPPGREDDPVPYWFFLLLFLQIALVYFDSLFFKFQCQVWVQGTVFWMASALPHFSYGLFPDALESEFLVRGLSYCALALEISFPLILWKPFRPLLWPVGFGLHLGIAIFFPIPLFGLAVCALYLMFIDWPTLGRWWRREEGSASDNSPSPQAGPHDRVGRGLVAFLIVSQLMLIWTRLLPIPAPLQWLFVLNRTSTAFTGLADNPVYVDYHFTSPEPILRFDLHRPDGAVIPIPSFDAQSYPEVPFVTGRIWVLNCFLMRFGSFPADQKVWLRYIQGWSDIEGTSLAGSTVKVYYHQVQLAPDVFDFQADDRIEREGWKPAGEFVFDATGRPQTHWRPEFVALFAP